MFRKLRLTQIGEITKGRIVQIVGKDGAGHPFRAAGWDPFRKRI
jgi:hypothetical protein